MIFVLAACGDAPATRVPIPVEILWPSPAAEVDGDVSLVARVGESSRFDWWLDVDGTEVASGVESDLSSASWATEGGPDGERVVRLRVRDTGGALGEAEVVASVRNLIGFSPGLDIVNPMPGQPACQVEISSILPPASVEAWVDGVALEPRSSPPFRWVDTSGSRVVARGSWATGESVQRVVEAAACSSGEAIAIDSPADYALMDRELLLVVQGVLAPRADVFLDGGRVGALDAAGSAALDTSDWPEGPARVRVVAETERGSVATAVVVNVDRAAPSITLELPDASVDAELAVVATAADASGIVSMAAAVAGEACESTTGELVCHLDSTGWAHGDHVVSVVAADGAGRTAETTGVVRVDHRPRVSFVSPPPDSTFDTDVDVALDVGDDDAVVDVRLGVDGAPLVRLLAPYEHTLDACALEPGLHLVEAWVEDSGGQSASAGVWIDVRSELAITNLVASQVGDAVVATLDTSGSFDVVALDAYVDGVWADEAVALADCDGACNCASWNVALDLPSLETGDHEFLVVASDSAGNVQSAIASIAVNGDADGDGYDDVDRGGTDCDDGDGAVSPAVSETCNGIDDDCSGAVDDAGDADGDGASRCEDCDDADAARFPGAWDGCDGVDNDCDDWIDFATTPGSTMDVGTVAAMNPAVEELSGLVVEPSEPVTLLRARIWADPLGTSTFGWHVYSASTEDGEYDLEAEYVGATGSGRGYYESPEIGLVLQPGQFYLVAAVVAESSVVEFGYAIPAELDSGPHLAVRGAIIEPTETDTVLDDPTTSWAPVMSFDLYHPDADDEDDDADGQSIHCGDCDDDDPLRMDGLAESCDGLDNDCDGVITDEDDADADGYRPCSGDCDDANALTYVLAPEACDGLDNDCDGAVSGENDADADGYRVCDGDCDDADAAVVPLPYYADADGDGFGNPDEESLDCPPPASFVLDATDCDDAEVTSYPGAAESCDGTDQDCDGAVDEDFDDDDADGWAACMDCDDLDGSSFPGGSEACGNAADEDCDGFAVACHFSGTLALDDFPVLIGEDASDYAGWSVAGGELDVTGDGLPDVVVGASAAETSSTYSAQGIVYVVSGDVASDADLATADALVTGAARDDGLGYVALLPDFDGDGFDDLLLGAAGADGGGSGAGAAYLLPGPLSGSVSVSTATLVALGGDPGDAAGTVLAALGDVSGDGTADFAVGARNDDSGGSNAGAVYIVSTADTGSIDLDADATRLSPSGADIDAGPAAGVGDVDGDGVDDVLVGAPEYSGARPHSGAAYLFLGPITSSLAFSGADIEWAGVDDEAYVGAAVSAAGDASGDGIDDILIGAWSYNDGSLQKAGRAYLMCGAPTSGASTVADACATATGTGLQDRLSVSMATLGDIDGDAIDDVILGGDDDSTSIGAAWVLYGPLSGAVDMAGDAVKFTAPSGAGYAGRAVAGLGDLDGDGHPDFGVGSAYADPGGSSSGAVYVIRSGDVP